MDSIKLLDFTFVIPFKFTNQDRLKNLDLVIWYLQKNLKTNIIIGEEDLYPKIQYRYQGIKYIFNYSDSHLFHRTKILNILIKNCDTKYVANYDGDILYPLNTYNIVADYLRNRNFKFVIPHNGYHYDIPKYLFKIIKEKNDLGLINLKECHLIFTRAVGCSFFFNKDLYFNLGLENENFLSWGFEDNERVERVKKFGYEIARTENVVYHLTHKRDYNSSNRNPYFLNNKNEFEKVQLMSKSELQKYINKW